MPERHAFPPTWVGTRRASEPQGSLHPEEEIAMRMTKKLGLCAAALVLAGACPAAAATPPDAWVTTKAKLALLTSDNVPAMHVNVDTTNGQVTLHGKVQSAAEKAEAERLAKHIDGVKGVRNMLQVVAEPRAETVKVADAELKERVEKA